jgi:competence protein ComEA
VTHIQQNIFKILILTVLVIVLLSAILPNRQSSTDYVKLFESGSTQSEESTQESEVNTDLAAIPGIEQQTDEQAEDNEQLVVYVDIKGAVAKPDMYALPIGSRVYDAIEMAGGLTEEAATETLNQAKLLEDQMLLYIYSYSDLEQAEATLNLGMVEPAYTEGPDSFNDNVSGVVNINSATVDELMTLPNIGPKKATAIIKFREENGSFSVVEDIMAVSGIGEKTFENLKDLITVSP